MHLLALLFSLGRRSFVAAHALPYYPHYRMEPEARHRAANEDTMIPALMMSAAVGARISLGNKVEGSSRCTVRWRSLCAATVKLRRDVTNIFAPAPRLQARRAQADQ